MLVQIQRRNRCVVKGDKLKGGENEVLRNGPMSDTVDRKRKNICLIHLNSAIMDRKGITIKICKRQVFVTV